MSPLGDWDLLEVIGQGAHAVVHRAVRRDRPGRVVAIKRLRDVEPAAVAAIRREAAVLSDLAHPAIAVLHEVVVDGDEVALILALATGGSLARRVAHRGRLPADEVVDLGRRLGGALATAHAVGVLHRDVTPTNVLYGREDEPRLADFGLSSAIGLPPDEVAGTATYLDPEVANGAPPGPASDTWGLAVVLWESLAGQPPWMGADDQSVRRAADRGLHLPLGQLVPDAPPDLVEVLERAILRDPHRRFRHPQQLERALAGLARPVAPARSPVPPTPDRMPDRPEVDRPEVDRPDAIVAETSGHPVPGSAATDPPEPVTGDAPDRPAADVVVPGDPGSEEPSDGPPDTAGASGGVAGGPPGRTTVFGPRPPAPEPEDSPAGWGWPTRLAVAVVVVVSLAVAGWAWARGRDVEPASPVARATARPTATPPPTPAASPTADGAPNRIVAPGLLGASSSSPDPTPDASSRTDPASPGPGTTGDPGRTTAPSTSGLPVGWVVRSAAPPCDPSETAPATAPDEVVLAADVSGFDCAVDVVVRTEDLDGRDHTVLEVPEDAGPLAGRYDLGPRGDAVVVGDWNGDGADTPAVVRADSGAVFTFGGWGDQDATATGQRPIEGRVAVATDPAGVDHVVPAASLPDPDG